MGSTRRINEIIDNDNERLKRNSMSMTMNRYGVRDDKMDEAEVDECAECLVSVFNSPGSKALYCDAVRYLTKSFLDEKMKVSLERGRNPAKYFGAIIYKKLKSIGLYQ